MSRAVNAPFEKFQSARVKFVTTVADLASKPQHIEALHAADVMSLLRPLLLDNVPSIQESAAIALGRLANHSEDLASDIVSNDILPHLVMSLSQQNRSYKKAAAYVLRSVAKHSEHLAQCVINAGALESLVSCLEEFDPEVKEVAALALGYIARHNNPTLALQVADAGAVPLLILCVQEPNVPLKRVAATAIGEIAKHSEELAHRVADTEGAIKQLTCLIAHPDKQLKKQVCACLANIAKHNEELAVSVTEADIFPKVLYCLKDSDPQVRRNAANCIREIAKQSSELANIIVHYGGPGALVDYLNHTTGVAKLPGIMTLGFIAGFDESLAMAVIVSEGIPPLCEALTAGNEDHVKAAASWSLGQLGRHSPQHAKPLCEKNVPAILLSVYISQDSSEDLKNQAKRALRSVIRVSKEIDALIPLVNTAQPPIIKYVLEKCAMILDKNVQAKKKFAQSSALLSIQEIKAQPGSKLKAAIDKINSLYPPDIVEHYKPEVVSAMMSKIT